MLLTNMLAIEKDLGNIKKKFEKLENKTERNDIGIKPETVSLTL